MTSSPVIFFKKLVPGGIPVKRASRDALGSIPVRGARYCEALTTSCAYGWYVYPLVRFSVEFDGHDFAWSYGKGDEWYRLTSAQYPNFARHFDDIAPENCKGYSPPWLARGQDFGILQIWTGYIVRTAPDWSVECVAPINIPHSPAYYHLGGIIETDRWGGHLFFNLKFVQTGVPVSFEDTRPYLQIHALPRHLHSDDFHDGAMLVEEGLDNLSEADWCDYYNTVVSPNMAPTRNLGRYAVEVRRRRLTEKQRRPD